MCIDAGARRRCALTGQPRQSARFLKSTLCDSAYCIAAAEDVGMTLRADKAASPKCAIFEINSVAKPGGPRWRPNSHKQITCLNGLAPLIVDHNLDFVRAFNRGATPWTVKGEPKLCVRFSIRICPFERRQRICRIWQSMCIDAGARRRCARLRLRVAVARRG